jgi:hypothetical protein
MSWLLLEPEYGLRSIPPNSLQNTDLFLLCFWLRFSQANLFQLIFYSFTGYIGKFHLYPNDSAFELLPDFSQVLLLQWLPANLSSLREVDVFFQKITL